MAKGYAVIDQTTPASEISDWVAVFGWFAVQAQWSALDATTGKIHIEVSQDGLMSTRLGSINMDSASSSEGAVFAVMQSYNYARVVVENTATTGKIRVAV
jgi:hypothetical protein